MAYDDNDESPATDDPSLPTLHSRFALEHLTTIASRLEPQLFTFLLRPVFGVGIPVANLARLKDALTTQQIPNPAHRVKDMSPLATYDTEARAIDVSRAAIEQALQRPETSAALLMALIEALGLYIDTVLRNDFNQASPDDAPTDFPPRPANLAAHFAATLLFYDSPVGADCTFATYGTSANRQPLKLKQVTMEPASAPEIANEDQGKRRRKRFAAGTGHGEGHASFGHESIEAVLKDIGFSDEQCKAIYFGNWLRDYSQLIDPKIVLPTGEGTNAQSDLLASLTQGKAPRIARSKLTALVDLLALKEFKDLQKTRQGREEYRVTPQILGVYRPYEHIDNPTVLDPNAIDPRAIDRDFPPLVLPGDKRNSLMPKRSMKRYIRRPIAYMHMKLNEAQKEGMSAKGLRYFGEALHVLEDYFAHSNFVELSLRQLGHEVLTWTTWVESKEASRHEWPVVTGLFGSLDIVASVIDPIAEKLYPDDVLKNGQLKPGERSDFDEVMLILLDDGGQTVYREAYLLYLKARDQVRDNWLYQLVNQVQQIVELPRNTIEHALALLKKPLLKWAGDEVATLQVHLDGDPNVDPKVMPSHSQLAKDHDTHPFHTLAVALASAAVEAVGRAMFECWKGNGATARTPADIAESFMVHPNDTEWHEAIVRNWAQANPASVEQGKSYESLRTLHMSDLAGALQDIERAWQDAEQFIKEAEELTGVSYWTVANMGDVGPGYHM